jgi:hypothetical protein
MTTKTMINYKIISGITLRGLIISKGYFIIFYALFLVFQIVGAL